MSINALLAEDNLIAQKATKLILGECDCKVDIASDGEEAIKHLKKNKNKYDILFIDYGLPDIKGPELVRKIRKLSGYQDIPIIALSAHYGREFESDYEKECLDAGMNAYYSKPLLEDQAIEIFKIFIPSKIKEKA